MATITTLDTGYCRQCAALACKGAGWTLRAFPARAFLLGCHGRWWLWDTGYAPHFFTHTRRGWAWLYRRLLPVHARAEQAACAQLRAMGIEPSDLAGIVLSHFHGDHISGLADFPGVPLYCSRQAWESARQLRGLRAAVHGFVPRLLPADVASRMHFIEDLDRIVLPAQLAPFPQARALPGCGGQIGLVALPGHAPGHLGAFVHTEQGWTLLASDAAWTVDAYRQPQPLPALTRRITHDPAAYVRTLRQLQQLEREGLVRIVLTHAPEPA